MNNGWVELEGQWHAIESTSTGSGGWSVTTQCGITSSWNQVQIDRLPGGGEKVHEDCQASPTPEAKPKRKSKAS